MAITINNNVASLIAQRNLSRNSNRLEGSIGRLTSGLRIAVASDDAAGLAISEKMRARIRSLQQAQRNAADGISLANTAEGAMNEISGMLVRMRELGMQAANGSTDQEQRDALNDEFQLLLEEIQRIAESTEFNGVPLLDGGGSTVDFQVGAETDPTNRITISAVDMTITTGLSLDGRNINAANVSDIRTTVDKVDAAITTVNSARGKFGAVVNRMSATVAIVGSMLQNVIETESRIRDVDVALETSEMMKAQVLQQAGMAVLAQANSLTQNALQLLRF